ncbi:hypothetical protein [Enterovibrio norvegicus]|uniref:hypothetical protein n=1 Tax=Enterovibrio norvegicus TaxID=188144 RepID=UPI00352DCABF
MMERNNVQERSAVALAFRAECIEANWETQLLNANLADKTEVLVIESSKPFGLMMTSRTHQPDNQVHVVVRHATPRHRSDAAEALSHLMHQPCEIAPCIIGVDLQAIWGKRTVDSIANIPSNWECTAQPYFRHQQLFSIINDATPSVAWQCLPEIKNIISQSPFLMLATSLTYQQHEGSSHTERLVGDSFVVIGGETIEDVQTQAKKTQQDIEQQMKKHIRDIPIASMLPKAMSRIAVAG